MFSRIIASNSLSKTNLFSKFKLPFASIRSLFIQTELTPNLDSIKFKPGQNILDNPNKTFEFLNARDAMKSPLASSLFRIDGVTSVFFGQDFITKETETSWQLLKPDIYGAIMDFVSTGKPIISDQVTDTTITEDDSEVVQMIKELLDTRIRPTIQEDGGDIEYVGFEDGIVKVKLRGACRTCDSSTMTLKNGIENMLMHYISEVKEVQQVLEEGEAESLKEFEKLEQILTKRRDK
ncbi:hypothetical protein BC833DRAFT_523054 [Globomyces pollinis-pini]|nr:hypothetical protein BC833DRAFT_523054 [Globomyces pollinis-pini]KAJ2997152.1 hypothetical protein HDV02_005831 [Globomyces sp. JEL0801]